MAYIPPHKRLAKNKDRPNPTPELLVPLFNKNLGLRSSDSNLDKSGRIVYADHAISRWFAVGLDENDQFPSDIHLEPISLESIECRVGRRPQFLLNSLLTDENRRLRQTYSRSPWISIAENVMKDLLSSFKIMKQEIENGDLKEVKPTLVARFGKIFFQGSPLMRPGSFQKNEVEETTLRQLKRTIYTDIPSSYMENIIHGAVPKAEFVFEKEKDVYHVKLSDNKRPDATISCKCSLNKDKKLLLYKVELNPVRQMVIDISCLDKNLDLRLMLCTKRILTTLTDDEMNCIGDLINSAALDSDVKGGLRWPFGKTSSGDRFNVIGVWHTVAKAYKSPSLRLKVRNADRFDFRTGAGEATREVYLKMKKVMSALQEQSAESDSVADMLKDNLKLIWDHFFCCERFLK